MSRTPDGATTRDIPRSPRLNRLRDRHRRCCLVRDPTANDVFWTAPILSRATDLDPSTRRAQREVEVQGGTFVYDPVSREVHVHARALSCEGDSDPAALSEVHDMFIFFNDGNFVIDNVVLQ